MFYPRMTNPISRTTFAVAATTLVGVHATRADVDLLNTLTGDKPQTNFRDGVALFVKWWHAYYEK